MAYTTINKSTDYFNTKLYTGAGGTQNITGVGFQPDWVWIKERSQSESHVLFDAVRGVTKALNSNDNSADDTISNALTTFGTDGFTVGGNGSTNENSQTYVSWNWKAGTGQGSSNTDGSINTTYTSVNTTAGFSISQYTGTGSTATVGHGLGVAPKMIIFKNTSSSVDWRVYHESLGNTHRLCLNDTSQGTNDDSAFNDTSPTSSVFTVGGSTSTNAGTMIAYCFAEKTGYSKFGSYIGNGNADGTFVYTGFKPSFIIHKRTDNTSGWDLFDNKRLGYNVANRLLGPNNNDQEATSDKIDILSNGFKMRTTTGGNYSGATYVYMAFGQSLVGSNNVPCTAR